MASPPPQGPRAPPGPRGQGCGGGEGVGCWAVVGGVSLQASGHTLYWMPRKRHMAKIMAKSCKESRIWRVSLGSQPSRVLSHPKEKGLPALAQQGGSPVTLSTLSLQALLRLPWAGQALLPATGPLTQCGHEKKEAWAIGSNPALLFAVSKRGLNTSLLWA